MTRHLSITGRVQGVGYRAWFEEQARALVLSGWVRNRRDGSVEAVIAGPDEAVERMTALARRGPPPALVIEVLVTEHEQAPAAGFTVLSTL